MIDQNYGKAKTLKRLTWGATSTRNDGVCGYARTPFLVNEEPCDKPQGINSHITNTAAATLWQATGNYQVKSIKTKRNGKNEF
jgi:hypothetical protein